MKPILILSAIPEEIQDFLSHFTDIQTQTHGPFTTYHTQTSRQPLIFSTTGVGKVSAAMTTQHLIDRFEPRCILFTGLAGALNPTYEIGDLIIADQCIQYDIDASELGFPAGTIPYTEYHTFTPDAALLKLAQQIDTDQTVQTGTILTGDQFMTHDKRARFQPLLNHFNGDAIEMEGAALAHVCTHNQTPFLLLRTISDKANAEASLDFSRFLKTASKHSFELIQFLINMISE
jgi:5'-methylthioadenosine/S-adenosylhomocysteine nucleosidase